MSCLNERDWCRNFWGLVQFCNLLFKSTISLFSHLYDCLRALTFLVFLIHSLATMLIVQEDYINTSHPNFIGGSKAVEQAQQQVRSAKMSAAVVRKVCMVMSTAVTNISYGNECDLMVECVLAGIYLPHILASMTFLLNIFEWFMRMRTRIVSCA